MIYYTSVLRNPRAQKIGPEQGTCWLPLEMTGTLHHFGSLSASPHTPTMQHSLHLFQEYIFHWYVLGLVEELQGRNSWSYASPFLLPHTHAGAGTELQLFTIISPFQSVGSKPELRLPKGHSWCFGVEVHCRILKWEREKKKKKKGQSIYQILEMEKEYTKNICLFVRENERLFWKYSRVLQAWCAQKKYVGDILFVHPSKTFLRIREQNQPPN